MMCGDPWVAGCGWGRRWIPYDGRRLDERRHRFWASTGEAEGQERGRRGGRVAGG